VGGRSHDNPTSDVPARRCVAMPDTVDDEPRPVTAGARWRRHSPTHHSQFALVTDVAHHMSTAPKARSIQMERLWLASAAYSFLMIFSAENLASDSDAESSGVTMLDIVLP
jgi:hypothetical protein